MIKGSLVALVTPMDHEGGIDRQALKQLVEFHIAQGTDGIVAVGTTGESATLNFQEHADVIGDVVRLCAGRVPVIAGTGANSTREAIALTRDAAEAGADACLSVVPYYNKPTQEGLYRHFCAIVEAVELPLILYNVPGRTACDMLPQTVKRLAEIERIIGIKEAVGECERIAALLPLRSEGFAFYSGDDISACDALLMGADGVISVTANVVPAMMRRMCAAALAERKTDARVLQEQMMPLHHAMFVEPNPIPVKWALTRMGMIESSIRLPLTPLDDRFHQQVQRALADCGVMI